MPDHCSYDCSRQPDKIEVDSDITGTGVMVGYVAAAGIAVIVISVHYFLVYDADLDPFRDKSNVGPPRPVPFQPNPVDVMILRYIRRPFRAFQTVKSSNPSRWLYLNTALTRCILAMSDLQLATGIAILISGYAQLHCGLSSYHWVVIGRLAWFSSLTHLSCLTFLRNYLYNRKPQRQWRVALMLLLIIMLITAMAPTARYDTSWNVYSGGNDPQPSDYAICWFSTLPAAYPLDALLSVVVLALLAGVGFLTRAIKLHKPLSDVMAKMRASISQPLRRLLWVLCRWKGCPRRLQRFTGNTLYYLVLAFFLSLRLTADHFSSMFFEVYWLLAGFLIGLLSLLRTIHTFDTNPHFIDHFEGVGSNNWTFGQVMPLILLALPLINLLESFYPDDPAGVPSSAGTTPTNNISDSARITSRTRSTPLTVNRSLLDPNTNYYRDTTAMGAGAAYILACELGFLGFALFKGIFSTPVFAVAVLKLGCITVPIALWSTVLVSFPIDLLANRKGTDWYLRILQPVNVVFIAGVSALLMPVLIFAV